MSMQANGFNPDELKTPSGSFLGGGYAPGDGAEYDVLRPSDGHVIRAERGASARVGRPRGERRPRKPTKRAAGRKWRRAARQNSAPLGGLDEKRLEEIARLESLASCRLINETRHFDIGFTAE